MATTGHGELVQTFRTEQDMLAWFRACGHSGPRPGTYVVHEPSLARPWQVWGTTSRTTGVALTLTGREAIEYARIHGLTLSKYTDPTEEAREGLSIEEAEAILREDPSLIHLETQEG